MVLHNGKIAEMRTGEGKTLVATLAVYLNALPNKGVHVITVNDYLARRDAEWMGRLYNFLGLSIGVINGSGGAGPDSSSYLFDAEYDGATSGYRHLRNATRREAYSADITYGTNNEYGFDYLRDNMAFEAEQRTQQNRRAFAVVDEVDSILIDEARTPLIISGPTEGGSELYKSMNSFIPQLTQQEPIEDDEGRPDFGPGDYSVDEKSRQAYLSDAGHEKVEKMLEEMGLLAEGESLYDSGNISLMHHVNAALRAHALFQKNVDYIVTNGEVIIVDEFTGRTMPGRRWSDGLHQAVEAKEGVEIQKENQTLASITFQNYFRLYGKLSGMTGTADTEAFEFQQTYGLEVVVIPPNLPTKRDDMGDLIYLTADEKYAAIIEDVEDCVERGQPVLVGTASIETSELVSTLLKEKKVDHQVLNAKQHEREAGIVAEAGEPGRVTIATNMAGRGTDIVLGGNPDVQIAELGDKASPEEVEKIREQWKEIHQQVLDAGGLRVVCTERNESRRIDNQLRGRSGRQGDAGSSRFYLSLEDNLMRIFASERVSGIMQKLGMDEGEAIEHPWVTKAIANAQKKVEGRNFDIRKQLLEYDDVMNQQRDVIYSQRRELLEADDISDVVEDMRLEYARQLTAKLLTGHAEEWDLELYKEALEKSLTLEADVEAWRDACDIQDVDSMTEKLNEALIAHMAQKEEITGVEQMRGFEKWLMLNILDQHWKDHLLAMDHLRQSVGLRGYAQKQPLQEYKRESFELFAAMIDKLREEAMVTLHSVQIEQQPEVIEQQKPKQPENVTYSRGEEAEQPEPGHTYKREQPKVGRNDPCPCGSGKKYKQCHGRRG